MSYSRTDLKVVTWSAVCGLDFFFLYFVGTQEEFYKVEKISVDSIIFFFLFVLKYSIMVVLSFQNALNV